MSSVCLYIFTSLSGIRVFVELASFCQSSNFNSILKQRKIKRTTITTAAATRADNDQVYLL